VQAVATDTSGNCTTSTTVTINKDATTPVVHSGAACGGPPPPPTMTASITSPADGATVSGTSSGVSMAVSNAQSPTQFVLKLDNTTTLYNQSVNGTTASTTWNTTTTANGTHTLTFTATDAAGKTATASISVMVNNGGGDLTPPAVTITKPANGAWTGNSIEISATASDNVAVASLAFWGNGGVFGTVTCGGTPCTGTVTWVTGPLAPAAYQVQVVATDSSGNKTVSAPVTINKDATSPVVPSGATTSSSPPLTVFFDHPANGATVCGSTIGVGEIVNGGTGARSGTLAIDGTVVQTFNAGTGPDKTQVPYPWQTSGYANGPRAFKASVSDQAGAMASASLTLNLANPSATITTPANGATVHGTVPVTITSGDACSTRDFGLTADGSPAGSLTGTTSQTATFSWDSTKVPDGAHTLAATVSASGITSTKSITVTVHNNSGGDTTPPTVTITKPSNGAWTGNSIDVTATGSDDVGVATLTYYGDGTQFAQVACGGTASCTSTQWWLTGSLASGQHTITVVATDTSGNQTTSAPVAINK